MIYDFYFTFSGQVPTDVPDTLGDLPRASSSSVDPAAASDPGAGDDVLGDMEEAAAAAATASTPKGKRKRASSRDEDDWVDEFKSTMAQHMSILEKILAEKEKRKPATKKDSFIAYVTEYLQAADGPEFERLKYGILQLMHYGPAASAPPAGPSGSQQYQPVGTPHYQPYYGQAGPSMWTSTSQHQQQPALPQATLHFTSPSKRISSKSLGKILESINNEYGGWSDDV